MWPLQSLPSSLFQDDISGKWNTYLILWWIREAFLVSLSFIGAFNKHLLSVYYVSSFVQGPGDTVVNPAVKMPAYTEFTL